MCNQIIKNVTKILSSDNPKNKAAWDCIHSINHDDQTIDYTLYSVQTIERKIKEICYRKENSDVVQKIPPFGVDYLLSELQRNILLSNHWSVFYLTCMLSERYGDLLVFLHHKLLSEEEIQSIKTKLDPSERRSYLNFDYTITRLGAINKILKSDYISQLIEYLRVFQKIRNKFMFHFKDVDEYAFVYSSEEIHQKEEYLKDMLIKINGVLEPILQSTNDKHILELITDASGQIDASIKLYDDSKDGTGSFLVNDLVYGDLVRSFSKISFAFIIFLGATEPDF